MLRFLESICYDGKDFPLLRYHQERVNRVFKDFYTSDLPLQLSDILPEAIAGSGVHKVRVLYNDRDHKVEAIPYDIRPISSLQVVHSAIEYRYKYTDRSELDKLFQARKNADDVLIVRNGLLTDTSYANIALLKGNLWYTPEKPLLPGTRRAKLIKEDQIIPAIIHPEDMQQYEQLSLFNAMIDLGEVRIPIGNIAW